MKIKFLLFACFMLVTGYILAVNISPPPLPPQSLITKHKHSVSGVSAPLSPVIFTTEPAIIMCSTNFVQWTYLGITDSNNTLIVSNYLPFEFFRGIVTNENILVQITPSIDTNVVGYNIYYGSQSSNYTSKINIGNNTNTIISIPNVSPTNYFNATDYDVLSNESGFCNECAVSPNPLILDIINSNTNE
jgi:hypothetical protein